MAKTQCRKCGQVYEINEVGVFKCSACGEFLPPVAIAVNEEQAPAVSTVPATVTTPIAPAASPECKSRSDLFMLLAVAVVVLLVAGIIGIGFYVGRNQGKPAERSSVSPLLTAQSTEKSISGNKESVSAKSEKASSKIITLPGNVKMQLNLVKAGSFNMGSPECEKWHGKHRTDEKQNPVTLTKDFYIGVTEVTQGQYRAIMKDNPARFKGDDLPVECVTWYKAMEFCERLNEYAPDGWRFTLPTEAQWEFAARGGNKGKYTYYTYSGSNDLDSVGWYYENSGNARLDESSRGYETWKDNNCKTHPVARKRANALGLYDMSGNVSEWCLDNYISDLSNVKAEFTLNYGDSGGSGRVFRGGEFRDLAVDCRSAYRNRTPPVDSNIGIGFRVALVQAD